MNFGVRLDIPAKVPHGRALKRGGDIAALFFQRILQGLGHGQASHRQDQARQHGGHRFLLRHEEESPHDD